MDLKPGRICINCKNLLIINHLSSCDYSLWSVFDLVKLVKYHCNMITIDWSFSAGPFF